MKFRRRSVQAEHAKELKSVAPSLLSDPAFSADPHSNPYYVLNGEPASPPVGHPALKSKNRRQPSNFAHPISASDFDFDLIPPPNSPVAPSVIPTTIHFPVVTNNPPLPAPSPAAFQPPVATYTHAPAPVASATNTSSKEGKKRRMPFLSRRKSSAQQPEPPRPVARQILVPTSSARVDNDVTQSQRIRPAPAPRNASELPKSVKTRPAFPLRSATVSGASTPTARTGGKSSAPSQISNSRTQDLDRIDELDETNPWGIALHHGGPYEAATQALRSTSSSVATGTGSSMLNEYPRQALHAHGNLYVPPQVPTGVSLNLSPGQILPRNFDTSPQAQYPRHQAAGQLSSHKKPPLILVPGTPVSRRQSQPLPLLSPGPLPNPHPMPSPMPPRDPPLPKGGEPQLPPEPAPEPEPDRTQDMPFDIGMAMLHPSASSSSIPSIYLHPETSDDSEFDPYDPVHLEREHPRATPSPFDSSAEQSRGPSPDPQPQQLIPQSAMLGDASENPNAVRGSSPMVPRDLNTPPPYYDVEHHHLLPIDHSRSPSREPSPGPSSSSVSHGAHDQVDRLKPTVPESYDNDVLPSSLDRRETRNDMHLVAAPPQSSRDQIYNLGSTSVHDRDTRNTHPATPMAPDGSSYPNIHNIRPQERDIRSTDQISQMPPIQSSGKNVQSLGPLYVQDRDARSTHHTISTYTSSQMRNGPPPQRHVPKHLVMPTPLQSNPNDVPVQSRAQFSSQSLPSQFGPAQVQVQVRAQQVRAQPRVPYPQHTPYPPSQQLFSPVHSNAIPPTKQLVSSSKLRKKLSTKITPSPAISPASIVTTVSFAPPVIGYGQSSSTEKFFGRSKGEKIPKRVLSKRRTDF